MAGQFNPDLFRVARQLREYSQIELSEAAAVSQGNISKLENGLIEPTSEVLEKLANALHFPVSFFYEPDRAYGLPISVHPPAYRKKASVGERALHRLEAELNIRIMHLKRLLKAAAVEPELPLPRLDVDEYDGSPERVAELLRRTWLVPNGPIRNLIELIERAGCIVIQCDFGSASVDGVTINAPGVPPCIFLNRNQSADRQRFTLSHELGHVVMHRVPSPDMEQEADAFASAFLMPARDVKPYLSSGLTLQRLASLKPVWRVSMAALLYRAKVVGAISQNQSTFLWKQLSRMGYRLKEPPELDFAPEKPSVLSEILRVHLEELGYEIRDLCKILHAYDDDIRSWLPLPNAVGAAHLRLVN